MALRSPKGSRTQRRGPYRPQKNTHRVLAQTVCNRTEILFDFIRVSLYNMLVFERV